MSATIILLCEDSQTDSFVRRFLRHRKIHGRDIHTLPLPGGRQSGEQWVRKSFPCQLKAIRRRQRAVLLVVIDADTTTTHARRTQLDRECRLQKVAPRSPDDPVMVIVPRRNIETWFHFLESSSSVDETARYPKLNRQSGCHRLADELYRICHERQALPRNAPPSLRDACGEYPRLSRLLR